MIELNTSSQVSKRKCTKCGKELMDWETVCPECGQRTQDDGEDHVKYIEESEYGKPDYQAE